MTRPPEEVLAKVCTWVEYADEDLCVARHTLSLGDERLYRLVAYHAQQCAEKYLKAFPVLLGVDFPYTHNIARLLELCADRATWGTRLQEAEELTPFAITSRHPGTDESVN